MTTQDAKSATFGQEINGPGKTFFDDEVIDNMWDAVLELTAAVWTYRDRSIILEKVLGDALGKDTDISALVEAYKPTDEDNAQRERERAELVANVFRGFTRKSGSPGADRQRSLVPGETEE